MIVNTIQHPIKKSKSGDQPVRTHVLHTTSAATTHTRFPRLKLPNTMRLHPTRFFVKAALHDCILGEEGTEKDACEQIEVVVSARKRAIHTHGDNISLGMPVQENTTSVPH